MYWYFSYQPRRYDCGGRCTARHRSWWSSFNAKKRNDEEAKVVWVCVREIYYKYTILYIIWESSPHSLFSILKRRVIRLTPTAKPLAPTAKPWLSSKFLIPLYFFTSATKLKADVLSIGPSLQWMTKGQTLYGGQFIYLSVYIISLDMNRPKKLS